METVLLLVCVPMLLVAIWIAAKAHLERPVPDMGKPLVLTRPKPTQTVRIRFWDRADAFEGVCALFNWISAQQVAVEIKQAGVFDYRPSVDFVFDDEANAMMFYMHAHRSQPSSRNIWFL